MNCYKNKISFIILLISLILSEYSGFSQTFGWKAKITPVEKASYYKIFLNPEITSKLHHGFPDIRLYDKDNNEVQYILKQQKTIYDKGKRTELNILKNKHRKFKHFTEVIIENTENTKITNLIFEVLNTHNPVFIKISGSNDQKKWFILRNNYPAVPDISNADTTEIKVMNLPESEFKYYKILFHDYDETKINPIKVFYHNTANVRAEYVPLPRPSVSQKDTLNKSMVTVEFNEPQYIDMLVFGIQGPEFYLRKVKMQKEDTVSNTGLGEEFFDSMNKDFWFGSLKSNRINLADYKAKKIVFVIDNKDNQPLKIFKVNAYQLKNYMVSYLEPDKKYTMYFGSDNANFPSYDLPYFKDTIPEILPEAFIYDIRKIKNKTGKIKAIWNFPVKYLWLSIGSAALILLIISILMIRQNANNKTNNNY